MAKLDPTKFRVSSALKTIIGKELITDDFIAVFELVKNAFDANARRVDIIFKNLYSDDPEKKPSLIIKDNGKGMDKIDLVEKWLFVAYSAKKEGVEDYRDKIKPRRMYAGAKGIGRFSCDKLGAGLTIYTKKRGQSARINKIIVDWSDFEEDSKKEFIHIPVKHSYVKKLPYDNFKKGTILEIRSLREEWDRKKLLKLKNSLEKLINPNQGNDPKGFSIQLSVKEELEEDNEEKKDGRVREIVNGRVENRIFDDLEIKTTKIKTEISEDGNELTTILEDRGTLIYKVKEKNPYKGILKNISIHLFALNHAAKINFKRNMGVPSVQYGSVFLFKNGFRIYPFGEEKEDSFGLDRRKIQGQARFLGTRDVIGRIEINGPNDDFKETSSRDGGLIKNEAFEVLKEYFFDFAVKRLEKFVVGVLKWGHEGDLSYNPKSSQEEMQEKSFGIIERLTASDDIIDLNYDPKILNILKNRSEKSVGSILHNLRVLAEKNNTELIAKEIIRAQRQFNSLLKAKEEAEAEAEKAREEAQEAEEEAKRAGEEAKRAEGKAQEAREELKQKTSQNLFLQSIISQDLERIVSLHHHIGISASAIEQYIKNLSRKIKNEGTISPEAVQIALERISYQAKMISSTAKFATKANFNLEAADMEEDIITFFKEYLINVCAGIIKITDDIDVEFKQQKAGKFITTFRPLEISIIIDNMLSNSRKAGAKKFSIIVADLKKDSVVFAIRDNGKGILKKNVNKISDMGFTTTDGSGLGLCHVYKIIEEMGGQIKLNTGYDKGAEFLLRFKK